MKIAIMQPYFIPYAGYFRLFAATDLFVIYDCVQFPRRGWVHRNQLVDINSTLRWMTLPLEKVPQQTAIKELKFREEPAEEIRNQLMSFKVFKDPSFHQENLRNIKESLLTPALYLVDYLEQSLKQICNYLDLPCNTVRSSSLNLSSDFHGQERIIEICKVLGARTYVNAPGGRSLYDHEDFKKHNLELKFLSDYEGEKVSVLQSLVEQKKEQIEYAIKSQSA